MDPTTKNIFVPVQTYLAQYSGLGALQISQAVNVSGLNNVFFGPRYDLGSQSSTVAPPLFYSNNNTYIGVTSTAPYTVEEAKNTRLFTDSAQQYNNESVMIGNNFQLPPAGLRNTLIANDLTWKFSEQDAGNVMISAFTPASYLTTSNTNVPAPYTVAASNWVVIGYPDPALIRTNGVLINGASFTPNSNVITPTNRVIMNLKSVTSAQESPAALQTAGIPVKGLFFNSDLNLLRIRLQ